MAKLKQKDGITEGGRTIFGVVFGEK